MERRIIVIVAAVMLALSIVGASSAHAQNWTVNPSSVTHPGMVGIGILAPLDQLHVQGNRFASNPVIRLSYSSTLTPVCLATSQFALSNPPLAPYSQIATLGDLVIRTVTDPNDPHIGSCAEDIILSAQAPYAGIRFATGQGINETEKMTLTWNGNLGIGTVNPQARFHARTNTAIIEGDGTLNGGASSPELLFKQTTDPDYWAILKRGSGWQQEQSNRLHFSFKDVNSNGEFWSPAMELLTNGYSKFFNNVAIGVEPVANAKLYVKGNTMVLEGDGTLYGGASSPELLFKEEYVASHWAILKRANGYGTDQGNRLHFSYKNIVGSTETWAPSLELLPNGYGKFYTHVGIGVDPDNTNYLHVAGKTLIGTNPPSTSPYSGYMLAVDGLMVAKEIRVATTAAGWPDYVFSKEYRLMPLEDLESSIRENKHLPGIPSAEEMEKQGVNVGEIQAKLLQKMEEMTLYMIELKKENSELRSKLITVEETLNKKR